MKHAYLIIAHSQWQLLETLMSLLDYPNNYIFIHIDKKSKGISKNLVNICTRATVNIYSEFKVYWGGYSQIQVELFLLDKATKVECDYYHLLSGQDLPIKTHEQIDGFFEKNFGKEFVEVSGKPVVASYKNEFWRRTALFHFFQNYRRRYRVKILNQIFTFIERQFLLAQIFLKVNRIKGLNEKLYLGSNWFSISHNFALVILEKRDWIVKIFKWSNCGDELFCQTILMNSDYKDKLYTENDEAKNMRLIDWSRAKNGNPWVLTYDDLDMINESNCLFARKFSYDVDKNIIYKIIEKLKK